jgi:soluble lytic murein transglycosylase
MSAHPNSLRDRPLTRGLLAGLILAFASQSTAADEARTSVRAAFGTAYQQPSADPAAAAGDSAALRAYPLYPWLRAARLKAQLTAGLPQAEDGIATFLAEQGEAPAGRELRRLWLARLAERQDWAAFLAAWREDLGDETLRCRALDAWLATGATPELAQSLAERWVAEAELPAECGQALTWLRRQPVYDAALIERRMRKRLVEGDSARARPLLADLPAARRPPLEAWLALLDNPAAGFAQLAAGGASAIDDQGLRESWQRYARRNTEAAVALLPRLLVALKPSMATTEALSLSTALPLAWSRDPGALGLFQSAAASGEPLDERALEWRLRAALWNGEWLQVLAWTDALPAKLASQPRWRYWRARALEALGKSEQARPLYRALTAEFDTYGLLASWRLGQAWTPPSRRVAVVSPEARATLAALPSFARAEEAWALQLRSIASLEWRATYDALDPRLRPALVAIAGQWGWYDQAVVTATRQGLYDDVPALFPRPYEGEVQQAAALSGTPPMWIHGVMRKESVFKADAVSAADAIGLLQLLPSTAKLVAKRNQRPAPSREQLFDPAVNLPLGALHLRELADQYQGRWILALAAYNAGARAAERWRPSDAAREADVWIENIPYNETRVYVQRILLHAAAYDWLETGKPVRAAAWLPPVTPSGSP